MVDSDPNSDGPESKSAYQNEHNGWGWAYPPGMMPPGAMMPPEAALAWMSLVGMPMTAQVGYAPTGPGPGGPWPGGFMPPHCGPAATLAVASMQAADAMMRLLEARAGLWRHLFSSLSQAAATTAHAGQTAWDRTPQYADPSVAGAQGGKAKTDAEIDLGELEQHLDGLPEHKRQQVIHAVRMTQEMSRRWRTQPHSHAPHAPDADYDW